MEAQSVVVIQDASRGVNLKIFDWALKCFLLKAGDKLTLVIVLHQVITPMGYKSSVDSRNMVGANPRVIDAEVARKKEEHLNNEELVKIFKLYQSKKVEFNIEVATGSSPKAVALKIAMKLKATWVILDRKMKNDEEYFLRKVSCGMSRLRRCNRITHLRERPGLYQERQDNTHESIPVSMPDSVSDSVPDEQGYYPKINPDEAGCSSNQTEESEETNPVQPVMANTEISNKPLVGKVRIDGDQKLKPEFEDSNKGRQQQKSESTEVYQESEEFISCGGAKNFYLGRAEEYIVCERIFHFV